MGRVFRHIAGWALLVLGAVGLVLPVLQGWLFIGIGALLLAPDIPFFARLVHWVERRVPAVGRGVEKARRWLARRTGPPRGS